MDWKGGPSNGGREFKLVIINKQSCGDRCIKPQPQYKEGLAGKKQGLKKEIEQI